MSLDCCAIGLSVRLFAGDRRALPTTWRERVVDEAGVGETNSVGSALQSHGFSYREDGAY